MNNEFNDIFIYVPTMRQIIRIDEGSGDNLTYEVYNVQQNLPEVDGGMVMLTELFQNKFKSVKDAIPAVLDMAYGDESIEYSVLD